MKSGLTFVFVFVCWNILGVGNTINPSIKVLESEWGYNVGSKFLKTYDFDSDGVNEIICSAVSSGSDGVNYWYILKQDTVAKTLYQSWISPLQSDYITALDMFDYNSDAQKDAVVAFQSGRINIVDLSTKNTIQSITPVNEPILSLLVADADNDNIDDLIVSTSNVVLIIDLKSLKIKQTINEGADYICTGNIKDTITSQLVLSSGSIYMYKDASRTYLGSLPLMKNGFQLADLDSDGVKDIIVKEDNKTISVYGQNFVQKKASYVDISADIKKFFVADIDGNGTEEIMIVDSSNIHCLNTSMTENWTIPGDYTGMINMNTLDMNNDGYSELFWTILTPDLKNVFNVYDQKKDTLLFSNASTNGSCYTVVVTDVDGDKKDEIVTLTSIVDKVNSQINGALFVFDAATGQLKKKDEGNRITGTQKGAKIFDVADIDNDGDKEIVVAGDIFYKGFVWVLDAKTLRLKDKQNLAVLSDYNFITCRSMSIGDVDADGNKELVVIDEKDIMYVINLHNWTLKRTYAVQGTSNTQVVKCFDINSDGADEILLCSDKLSIFNYKSNSIWKSSIGGFCSMTVFDWNGDKTPDIILGNAFGQVFIYDKLKNEFVEQLTLGQNKILSVQGLRVLNTRYLLYTTDGKLCIYQGSVNVVNTKVIGLEPGNKGAVKLLKTESGCTDVLLGTSTSLLRVQLDLLGLSSDTINLAGNSGSSDSIFIQSASKWTQTNHPDWLSITSDIGAGNAILKLSVQENPYDLHRYETIQFKSELGIPCSLVVSQSAKIPDGIKNENETDHLLITSDDFKSSVKISNTKQNAVVTIYDNLGRVCLVSIAQDGATILNVNSFSRGVYMVLYRDGKIVKTEKFIKY